MTEALLVLEDGAAFRGRSFGATGEAFGEAVFNTAMTGYQEVLTDPSYARQVVTMTYPHQGNYGTNRRDGESDRVQVAALVVREAVGRPSNWRSERAMPSVLEEAGVVGIEGIDTRRLTLRIREGGAMRCAVSTVDLDPGSLLDRVRDSSRMEGADLARAVSTSTPYLAGELVGPAKHRGTLFRVAAYDFGVKRNMLRLLGASGCDVTVYPAHTRAEEVLGGSYDGVFLSNGPGDPAATTYGVEAARQLLGRIPLFGICLGHQLLGRALGFGTYKLKFGHRGANQPVLDCDSGRVEITSHNHGFAVDPRSVGAGAGARPWEGPAEQLERTEISDHARRTVELREREGPGGRDSRRPAQVVETVRGAVALTHWNLNDGTLEGLRCLDAPAFSVQYHPEAGPGPHDARYLFERFRELMSRA